MVNIISPVQGDLGVKTDRNNLLTYTVTGTMSTITEKVNGVTVGTKTATSGQSVIAGLTQAQWDAIKYGKYKDVTGGSNTLTVEMGTDVWTYTFDKRLATDADIVTAIKAVQDSQNTYLPAVKSKLASAIRGKGGTVNDTDSFDVMVSAVVGGMPVKKYATGTVTSGTLASFTYVDGTTVNFYPVTVTGLSFTPKLIEVTWKETATSVYSSTYIDNLTSDIYPKIVKLSRYDNNDLLSVTTYAVKGDVSSASVSNTGFTLPVNGASSTVYTWEAYGDY